MKTTTHIVCSNALALAFVRPDSPSSLLLTLGAATLGGTISDLDVSSKNSHKYASIFTIICSIILIIIGLSELYLHIGINEWILDNSSYFRIISCFFILVLVCYFGYLMPHRSFLHSFLGIFILCLLCYISLGKVVIPFMIGIISHVLLDLLTIKGIRLFYPLKNKYSLKLCVYNGKVNYYLFNIFYSILIIELCLLGSF